MSLRQLNPLHKPMLSAPMLPRMLRPCSLQLSREQRSPMSKPFKKPRPPKPAPSRRPKLLTLWPSRILRPRGPPRPSYSRGNMAKSCKTWRSMSSERKADAKVTSSLLARLPYMPAWQRSNCWGRPLCPIHSPYHKGPPKWRNSLLQQLLPCWCPSSLLGPKGGTFPRSHGEHASGQNHVQLNIRRAPRSKQQEVPPWNKALKPSCAEAFSWDSDLVKEARKEHFSKHSYNFIMEGTHNLSEIFK